MSGGGDLTGWGVALPAAWSVLPDTVPAGLPDTPAARAVADVVGLVPAGRVVFTALGPVIPAPGVRLDGSLCATLSAGPDPTPPPGHAADGPWVEVEPATRVVLPGIGTCTRTREVAIAAGTPVLTSRYTTRVDDDATLTIVCTLVGPDAGAHADTADRLASGIHPTHT